MNEVLRTIANRYSCRAYDGRLPEKNLLEALAMAAIQAPSGMNRQAWRIHVITNKTMIQEMDNMVMEQLAANEDQSTYQRFIDRGGKVFYNAPCMFLILKQPDTDMDCGIVSENIALAATSLGLDNVICGMAALAFKGQEGEPFRQQAEIPKGWEFGVSVLVGYGTKSAAPHEPDTSKIQFID